MVLLSDKQKAQMEHAEFLIGEVKSLKSWSNANLIALFLIPAVLIFVASENFIYSILSGYVVSMIKGVSQQQELNQLKRELMKITFEFDGTIEEMEYFHKRIRISGDIDLP